MENRTVKNDRNELMQLEPWEYQYYAFNFSCSEEELKAALNHVGNHPAELRTTLSK